MSYLARKNVLGQCLPLSIRVTAWRGTREMKRTCSSILRTNITEHGMPVKAPKIRILLALEIDVTCHSKTHERIAGFPFRAFTGEAQPRIHSQSQCV